MPRRATTLSLSSGGTSSTVLTGQQGTSFVETTVAALFILSNGILKQKINKWARLSIWVLELIQLLTIANESLDNYFGKTYFGLVRNPSIMGSRELSSWIALLGSIPLILAATIFVFELLSLKRGAMLHSKIPFILAWLILPLPILFLPLGNSLSTHFMCSEISNEESHDTAIESTRCFQGLSLLQLILSLFGFLTLIILCLYESIFHRCFLPKQGNPTAVVHVRSHLVFFVGKLLLIIGNILGEIFHSLHSLNFAASGTLFLIFFLFPPFYSRRISALYSGTAFAYLYIGVLHAIEEFFGFEGDLFIVIAQVVGAILAFILGYLLLLIRLNKFSKPLRKGVEECQNWQFSHPFEFEFCMKSAFSPEIASPEFREKVEALLESAAKTFPHSPTVPIIRGVFLMVQCHEPHLMVAMSKAARRLEPFHDYRLVLMWLLDHAANKTRKGDGPELQAQLDTASKHERLAILHISRFWGALLRHTVPEPKSLMKIARDIDAHEKRAGSLLSQLARKYPTTPQVLRRYGNYLLNLRNDKEAAEQLFSLAENYEHRKGRKLGTWVDDDADVDSEPDDSTPPSLSGREDNGAGKKEGGVQFADLEKGLAPKVHHYSSSDEHFETPNGVQESKEDSDDDDLLSIRSSASAAMRDAEGAPGLAALRKQIDSSGYRSNQRIHLSIIFLLVVLLSGSLVTFIVSMVEMKSYNDHLQIMNNTVEAVRSANEGLIHLRELEHLVHEFLDHHYTNISMVPGFLPNHQEAILRFREFQQAFESMYSVSHISSRIENHWKTSSLITRRYIPGEKNQTDTNTDTDTTDTGIMATVGLDGEFVLDSSRLVDASYSLLNGANFVLDNFLYSPKILTETPEFRYLFDNVPQVIGPNIETLQGLFSDTIAADSWLMIISVTIILPSTLVVVLFSFCFFYFTTRDLEKERSAAVNLLRDLPKSAIVNIYDKIVERKTSHGADADRSLLGKRTLDSLMALKILFVITILVCLTLNTFIMGLVFNFALDTSQHGDQMNNLGRRTNLALLLMYYSHELVSNDLTTYSTQELVSRMDDTFSEYSIVAQNLDDIEALVLDHPDLHKLWYDECTGETIDCSNGLGIQLRMFLDNLKIFYRLPHSQHTETNEIFVRAESSHEDILRMLTKTKNMVEEIFIDEYITTDTIIRLFFWVSFPVSFLLYFILRVQIARLRSEIARIFKMLLFIPSNVLENVPSVREYLQGEQTDLLDSQKEAAKSQQQHTKSILEASEDCVVVTDDKLNISMINAAAESTLGYTAAEALGKNLAILFPPKTKASARLLKKIRSVDDSKLTRKVRQLETNVRKADGTTITAWLSVSKSTLMGRPTLALFIRDMTELKTRERQIIIERKKAQSLLLNILPPTIAEALQNDKSGESGEVMAMEYESVSVLFADIVNFTPKSAGMEPHKLVHMLHSLFSIWDDLSLKFGVEKIKTIGDAYMAVSGAPVKFPEHPQVMMDYAIAMLQSLRRFNALKEKPWKVDLSIRVGINTGRVVAGVIGSHKFQYDIWGDAVNLASRMESTGEEGTIQVSETTHKLLEGKGYEFSVKNDVKVKGVEGTVTTYIWKNDLSETDEIVPKKFKLPRTPTLPRIPEDSSDAEPENQVRNATPRRPRFVVRSPAALDLDFTSEDESLRKMGLPRSISWDRGQLESHIERSVSETSLLDDVLKLETE